jgi:hypothetical protein
MIRTIFLSFLSVPLGICLLLGGCSSDSQEDDKTASLPLFVGSCSIVTEGIPFACSEHFAQDCASPKIWSTNDRCGTNGLLGVCTIDGNQTQSMIKMFFYAGDVSTIADSCENDDPKGTFFTPEEWSSNTDPQNDSKKQPVKIVGAGCNETPLSEGTIPSGVNILYIADGDLHFARSDSNGFECVTIGKTVGQFGAMASGIDDHLHATYYQDGLHYAVGSGDQWETELIIPKQSDVFNVGEMSDIEVDSNGFVHIIYSGVDHLKYVTNSSGSWVESDIHDESNLNFPPQTFLHNDNLHIVQYLYQSPSKILYLKNETGSWNPEYFEEGTESGRHLAFAMDKEGVPSAIYKSNATRSIHTATRTDEGWIVKDTKKPSLTADGLAMFSMEVDSTSAKHYLVHASATIGYYTSNSTIPDLLPYAPQDLEGLLYKPFTSWDTSIQHYARLTLEEDLPHIVYFGRDNSSADPDQKLLRYSTVVDGAWISINVDSGSIFRPLDIIIK